MLSAYLAAWVPILGSRPDVKHLIFIDGFAGPGRSSGGEAGSPLLMLDAYARRRDRKGLGVTAHFYFIEKKKERVADLEAEIAKREPAPDIDIEIIHGDYGREFPAVVQRVTRSFPGAPIFAFIDPFGASPNPGLATELLALPRCEVLMFVPIGHFGDLFKSPDMQQTLESVFGQEELKRCEGLSAADRKVVMVEILEKRLKQTSQWVRAFEFVPAGRGGRTHFLFFGTNSKVGLARMKEAMWRLDPIAGQRFKDSTKPGQSVLFEVEPDLLPLRRALEDKFIGRPFSIEEAKDFTLFETPFLHNSHLKRKTLGVAERDGRLEPVGPDHRQRARTYPPGFRMRFLGDDSD